LFRRQGAVLLSGALSGMKILVGDLLGRLGFAFRGSAFPFSFSFAFASAFHLFDTAAGVGDSVRLLSLPDSFKELLTSLEVIGL
jgi:hypothetical protein